MAPEDIAIGLIDSLESTADAEPLLRTAVDREEALECIEQGMAVQGLIDLIPLRDLLLEKGAPPDLVVSTLVHLRSLATKNGLTPSSVEALSADEVVLSLVDSLELAANADPRLRPAVAREEATECIEQGMAVEGLIDLTPLRDLLLEKGAPPELVVSTVVQLRSFASRSGLTPSSVGALSTRPPPPTDGTVMDDGFLPTAEIDRERERMDRALVSVVVRNADLNVDMEQFRDHLGELLTAATATGIVELESLYAWLKEAGSTETVCQETVLALVSLVTQGNTRYQLILPSELAAVPEPRRKEILDAFNQRCPPETPPKSQTRPLKPKKTEEKAPPAWVPEKKGDAKKKKSSNTALYLLLVVLVGAGGYMVVTHEAEYGPVGDSFKLPADGMPCTMLLKKGTGIFCGMKAPAWNALSKAKGGAQIDKMKELTRSAAKAAGFKNVTFGLDTSH